VSAAIASHEALLRLGSFATVLVVMALAEALAPRRERLLSRAARWPHNVALVVIDSVVVRVLFPVGAAGVAGLCAARGIGLLNQVALPGAVASVIAVVALDLVIYLQHRVFHRVGWLWRIHRVHHADLDLDVTSGARFHPLEIVLSMVIKFAAVAALGAPVAAVIAFEVVLNATAMFNHANLRLPAAVDRVLRWLAVTPDMHRVHHSVDRGETDSNFGFNLPWWDRAFGTYRAQPAAGHLGMSIGLPELRDPACSVPLGAMLRLPFVAAGSR